MSGAEGSVEEAARTLHAWFLQGVQQWGDEIALIVAGHQVSYAQLDSLSGALARRVMETVPRQRGRVGLLAAGSVAAYAGYLAILRAGHAVVPLNVDYPPDRNRQVAQLAGLDAVLADAERDPSFVEDLGIPIISVSQDELFELAATLTTRELGQALSDVPVEDANQVAYLLFTSGSTGVPKGVPIRHRNLDAFLRHHIERYRIAPGCRMSQTFGLTFDPSVFDMFVAWGGGATLVVPTAGELLNPVGFVTKHALTHWYSVPSLISWARRTGALTPSSLPTLRYSLFAGEQLTLEQASYWADAAPHSTVENLYGPTELSVTVTEYRLPDSRSAWPSTPNGTVPIGAVYPHVEYRVDPGTGELQVRGPQRFDGYLDARDNHGCFHDEATPNAPHPSAAAWFCTGDRVTYVGESLVHLGRLDEQVKIMGRRVEMGDIEAALRQWAPLDDVVVVATPDGGGDLQLTAVYSGRRLAETELREKLRGHLPTHMIPARFLHLETVPLNANGKLDRVACRRLSLAEAATDGV